MASITDALTVTVTAVHNITRTVASASATSTSRAAAQGGIFEGLDPTVYQPSNPFILFVIQATIVIAFTRILHWPLSKLNQPRVIAEVITGVLLGPSVMGRIPGFTHHIFPTSSMPAFTLVANIGLVLFLFLVGLEVDLRFLVSNWPVALSVGAAGMGFPFGLGYAVAYGLYHQFDDEKGIVPISFAVYGLFIAIALAITAFPVLCRILTSLNLLGTPVGVIVLSAGVANDVVGWILLALCVALVNSSAGLTALWIFLVAVGYSLFLAFAVRPTFVWFLRRTGSLSNGPTQTVVALTIFLVLASSFFTGIIGIHPIFGAFMIGLICPHEGGFAIKLTEKIEDLISVLFLPLYFALSGLSTNLGLLDNGITWAYVVAITAIAFVGKIGGGTLASKLNGLVWRESFTIGCLMSCKGLVELIVLNIGLQAKILSTRTFTMFVVMALITTFATTPLTMWLYPPSYQEKLDLWKKGKIDWDGNPLVPENDNNSGREGTNDVAQRLLVYLRADGLSSIFSIIGLFTGGQSQKPAPGPAQSADSDFKQGKVDATNFAKGPSQGTTFPLQAPLRVHGLRLMELTERNSSVMKVSEIEEFATRDPLIKAFGSSAHSTIRDVTMTGQIAVVTANHFADILVQRATQVESDFILLPWSETGDLAELHNTLGQIHYDITNDPLSNRAFAALAFDVFEQAVTISAVGVFVEKSLIRRSAGTDTLTRTTSDRPTRTLSRTMTGLSVPNDYENSSMVFRSSDRRGREQISVLYTGTADDLYAVKLALQLARTGSLQVKIIRALNQTCVAESSKSASATEEEQQFEEMKRSIPTDIAPYVAIEDLRISAYEDDTVQEALLAPSSSGAGEITLFIGRSMLTERTAGQVSVSANPSLDRHKPLGAVALALISKIRSMNIDANMLIVQAKGKAPSDTERARKESIRSFDSS